MELEMLFGKEVSYPFYRVLKFASQPEGKFLKNKKLSNLKILLSSIVSCKGVVQLKGPVFGYYRVVLPRWGRMQLYALPFFINRFS